MSVCHYHGDRPGVGVCVRCREVICADCRTRLDGINHCHVCLRRLARRPEASGGGRLSRGVTAGLLAGAGWLVLFGLLWCAAGLLAR